MSSDPFPCRHARIAFWDAFLPRKNLQPHNPLFECNRERFAELNLRNVQLEEGEEFEEEDGRAVYSSQARAARNQLDLIGILDLQI